MAAKDDAALVLDARAGDRDAFAAIYDRHAPRVYDLVRSMLRDPDEAADVTQETFITAGQRLGQLREPAKLKSWILAIARHNCLREIKRRSRTEPTEEIEVTATDAQLEDRASESELAELIRAATSGLGPRDQMVLELAFRQDLSGQELGEALGVSTEHAYVLVNRAKDQMDRSLGALLVARTTRSACEELDSMLRGWDGELSPLIRKRVARHVDRCSTCGEAKRRRLSPAALLGAAPAFALPAALRQRVLGEVELVGHQGPPWTGEPGGFPPPMAGTRRRRVPWLAAAAAGLVLLGTAAGLGWMDTSDPRDPSVVGAATGTRGPSATLGSTAATQTTELGPTSSTSAQTGPTTTAATATSSPGPGTTTGPATTQPERTDPRPTTTAPVSTTQPTRDTQPVDRLGPELGAVTPARISVWEQRGDLCGAAQGTPTAVPITVLATDPSGVDGVTMAVGSPVGTKVSMVRSGDTGSYAARLGPFSDLELSAPQSVAISIVATDGVGNQSETKIEFTLNPCLPRPG